MEENRYIHTVDVGGSGIKVIVLDTSGNPQTERTRVETPQPATPEAVITAIAQLAARQGEFDRVSVGFPGVVRRGVTETAANLVQSGSVLTWVQPSRSVWASLCVW